LSSVGVLGMAATVPNSLPNVSLGGDPARPVPSVAQDHNLLQLPVHDLVHAGMFAEFETNLRRERQLEGIAKAKAAGVYKGRPPSIEASRVREMKAQGMRPVDIAKALQIGRASVYRVLGQPSR
jgi:hypothetical protein